MRAAAALLLLAVACTGNGPRPVASPTATTASPAPSARTGAPSPTASPTPSALAYVFPVPGCDVTYGRAHHDYPATDVIAPKGCVFVSPVRGRVDEVSYADVWNGRTNRGEDRGGLSVSIVGDDGVRYYGSHLSRLDPRVRPGLRVEAGARLGAVGTTGSARGTAPHLHFGISWPTGPGVWWVRRGVVPPAAYLDSWRAGGDRSPAAEVRAARARAGTDTPPCTEAC